MAAYGSPKALSFDYLLDFPYYLIFIQMLPDILKDPFCTGSIHEMLSAPFNGDSAVK